jgi:hypothetical protein
MTRTLPSAVTSANSVPLRYDRAEARAGGLARVNDLANGASAVGRDGRQEVSMIGNGWLQIAIFGAIVVAITTP